MELLVVPTVAVDTRCPRCSGNIFEDFDLATGWYKLCLQCGRPYGQEFALPNPRLGGKKWK